MTWFESFARARPRLVLTLLCLVLWTPGLFSLPPGDRDESRFVQATKQMLETGDYVRIMNGTEARNRKPIGIHWAQAPFAAAARWVGIATENPVWPYRLPSMLGGWVAVMALFAAGGALFDRRVALLAAGMLAATVVLVVEVHIAKTDAALLGAGTLAFAVLGRARMGGLGRGGAAVFWLAMGACVLLKGPVLPMVAGLAVVTLLAIERRGTWLRALRPGWGVPLMLAVVLPWFVAIGVATEGKFFVDAVGGDLGRKLSSGDDAHGGPPGLHLALLPLLFFPATAALPGAALLAWRQRSEPAVRFLIAWIVPAWLVFEAVPTKLPHYTLPLYPALCLLAAAALVRGIEPVRTWVPAGLAAVVSLGVAGAAAAAPMVVHGPPFIPALMAGGIVGYAAIRAMTPWRMALAVAVAPLFYAAVIGWELPRLTPIWLAPRVVAALPPGTRLGAVGFAEPSLMFLAGTGTRWMLAAEGVSALADGTIDALLIGDRDLPAAHAKATAIALTPRETATIDGFNVSRGRAVTLTIWTK